VSRGSYRSDGAVKFSRHVQSKRIKAAYLCAKNTKYNYIIKCMRDMHLFGFLRALKSRLEGIK